MAIAISTIGVKVSYAFETTAGTRPTARNAYTLIPQVKSIPSLNPQPDTIETTSFDNTNNKTYINGLKDFGGAMEFTANFTQELYDMWNGEDGVMEKWETAKASNLAMYICVEIPDITECAYLAVEPTALGLPELAVNSVAEATLYFTPQGDLEWGAKPTGTV